MSCECGDRVVFFEKWKSISDGYRTVAEARRQLGANEPMVEHCAQQGLRYFEGVIRSFVCPYASRHPVREGKQLRSDEDWRTLSSIFVPFFGQKRRPVRVDFCMSGQVELRV